MARRVALLAVLAIVGASCAEGSSISDLSGAGGQGGGGVGGRGAGGEGGDDGPATTSSSRASSSAQSSSGSGSTSSGGGEGGEGTTSSSSGTGTSCNFTSPNACATAENLGFIAGDEDGVPLSVQGSTSKWFTVQITEESSGISETDLSYRVALSSPAGMNYDVFVHQGPQDGGQDCGAAAAQGQSDGTAEVVFAEWDDDQGIGGEDDSVWLMIEVRWISGESCTLSDQWTLSIEGYI